MTNDGMVQVKEWLIERGLGGASEMELLDGFCLRCRDAGLELSRGLALVDTLHPVYEGRAFRWRNDGVEEQAVLEYGSSSEGVGAENWRTPHPLIGPGDLANESDFAEWSGFSLRKGSEASCPG